MESERERNESGVKFSWAEWKSAVVSVRTDVDGDGDGDVLALALADEASLERTAAR